MKFVKIFPLFLFPVFILLGCEKEELFDYRDKYVGEWKLIVKTSYFEMSSQTSWDRTDIHYSEITKGEYINTVVIPHIAKENKTFTVDDEGNLKCDGPIGDSGSGKFIGTDSLSIFYNNGGHGGGYRYWVEGKKVN